MHQLIDIRNLVNLRLHITLYRDRAFIQSTGNGTTVLYDIAKLRNNLDNTIEDDEVRNDGFSDNQKLHDINNQVKPINFEVGNSH